ncbi:hypothetical protein U9M48_037475 [Paspalum notatum var. saurae]|uniref:Uncharacterized protein n=1 Tax=Paspalum notatum var. saurae TaxID=547442 RepID=A0AAQ3ULA6_PASNO
MRSRKLTGSSGPACIQVKGEMPRRPVDPCLDQRDGWRHAGPAEAGGIRTLPFRLSEVNSPLTDKWGHIMEAH